MLRYYDNPTDMEPLLPADRGGELAALGWQVVKRAERLGGALHPITAQGLAAVIQVMNSYYSHLIEGQHTTPADLEAVLQGRPAGRQERRQLQQMHFAHQQAQTAVEKRLSQETSLDITTAEFLQTLHGQFYSALPDTARTVVGQKGQEMAVEPGQWRRINVAVGQHLAPSHNALAGFLRHFSRGYTKCVKDTGDSLVACAAAHHRLVWIHPFPDGNGRVARLFSHAWHWRSGIHAHGLWSVSRGLARKLDAYRSALAAADEKRKHDTDGRGYLSERSLADFCRFYLETCLDQLDFMAERLSTDTLLRRVTGHAELREATGDMAKGSRHLLTDVLLRGEIARGDAPRVIGKSPRTAQTVIRSLLDSGHLTSRSEKGPLRLGFPRSALTAWLPDLFV